MVRFYRKIIEDRKGGEWISPALYLLLVRVFISGDDLAILNARVKDLHDGKSLLFREL